MYLISKEELQQRIANEKHPGIRMGLQNHLRVMEGKAPVCVPCGLEEPVEDVQEVVEVISEVEDGESVL